MFNPHQKSTGAYTTSAVFLVVAFIFPAILIASLLLGYASVSPAMAFSALCVALAWVAWKRSSALSIPLAIQRAGAK